MSENIIVEGIQTNNLKNIDVEIVKNGINVIGEVFVLMS